MFGKLRVPQAIGLNKLYAKTKTLLGSRLFFVVIIALFVLQAGVVAIRSSYPLAFDESYHLGIIRLHSVDINPFFDKLPDSTGGYGPLETDPSYMFHYLLSFPYRLITMFTHNTFVVVLSLRMLNIAMFALGIVLFRKVLEYTGASKALINLVLLGFVCLPLQAFTAAHINYDNMVFAVTGAAVLLTLNFTKKIRAGKFDLKLLAGLTAICLFGVQVKYSFMPIVFAIGLFVIYQCGKWARTYKTTLKSEFASSLKQAATRSGLILVGAIILLTGLLAYRYAYNMAVYESPMPNCSKVLSVQACMAWGPWARDYQLGLHHTPNPSLAQKIEFAKVWINITGGQLLTILDGNKGGSALEPYRQLVIGFKLWILFGVVLVALQWRKFTRYGSAYMLFILICGIYLGVLILKQYGAFTEYGIPIAIQGRYLLPILLLMIIPLARAYSLAFQKNPAWKMLVLAVVLGLGTQGGGILTYMQKTDQTWYWASSTATDALAGPEITKDRLQ